VGPPPESIESFIEGPAFSQSYGLVPRPLTSPLHVRKLYHRLRKRDNLLTGRGGWGGRGAESFDRKKTWSSINHSILSGPFLSTLIHRERAWEWAGSHTAYR
jgi:hypothetical protein